MMEVITLKLIIRENIIRLPDIGGLVAV